MCRSLAALRSLQIAARQWLLSFSKRPRTCKPRNVSKVLASTLRSQTMFINALTTLAAVLTLRRTLVTDSVIKFANCMLTKSRDHYIRLLIVWFEMALKNFELTWVVYDDSDPYGFFLALFTLTPIFVMVMYGTALAFQRDLDTLFMVAGQLTNEALNKSLKYLIRHRRPTGASITGHGMPSAHAQFITFFSTFVVLYTWRRLNTHRKLEQHCTILAAVILSWIVCISRIRLRYHTPMQVYVGAVIGVLFAIIWFSLSTHIPRSYFDTMTNLKVMRIFRFRDISHIPDLIVYQHEICLQENKSK
uniref:Dolichyldiphosphatase n=1 Tax=Albugo laibachii Nc14 TaxID=890382 RepID=F0WG31_9STRA|nr:dolichyldiphosphatase 1 putative [Albugo laibachii Nc14]|eukprot:CCA20165.1 dolichyldiphosphatase 1 putative [Albugo laibachii Nc14]